MYFILIEGKIYQGDITLMGIFRWNSLTSVLHDHKTQSSQKLVIILEFSASLSSLYWSTWQRINRRTSELNDILHEMDKDIYRIFFPSNKKYNEYEAARATFFIKLTASLETKQASTNTKNWNNSIHHSSIKLIISKIRSCSWTQGN